MKKTDRWNEKAGNACRENVKDRGPGRRNFYRAAAMLLALGLVAGGVCAAENEQPEIRIQAEETVAGQQPDAEETESVQTYEEPEAVLSGAEDIDWMPEEVMDEGMESIPELSEDLGGVPEISGTPEGSAEAELILEEIETVEPVVSAEPKDAGQETDSAQRDGLTAEETAGLSGECGAQPGTVFWSVDEAGVLTVTGNGPMADWDNVEQTPWYPCLEQLRGIVLAEGVTSVGSHAFSGAQAVETVGMPKSIERIGAFAFFRCGGFSTITIG